MLTLIRLYFKTISLLFPKLAGKIAFNLFQKTRNRKIRNKERSFMESANKFKVPNHLEDIDCYEVGDPKGNLVLLVHGWESNAGSLAAIAYELVDKGFHVIAFNLPAHGYSKLTKANLKVCKNAFLAVLDYIQPSETFSIVSHSFGSAVTAYSMANSRFKADKVVFLTNPNKLTNIFSEFAHFIKLSSKAHKHLNTLASKLLREKIEHINVAEKGLQMGYNKVLLIHDRYDRIIPYHNSVFVSGALKNSELITLNKVGHYKMLWNKDVIKFVTDFLCVKTAQLNPEADRERMAS